MRQPTMPSGYDDLGPTMLAPNRPFGRLGDDAVLLAFLLGIQGSLDSRGRALIGALLRERPPAVDVADVASPGERSTGPTPSGDTTEALELVHDAGRLARLSSMMQGADDCELQCHLLERIQAALVAHLVDAAPTLWNASDGSMWRSFHLVLVAHADSLYDAFVTDRGMHDSATTMTCASRRYQLALWRRIREELSRADRDPSRSWPRPEEPSATPADDSPTEAHARPVRALHLAR